MEARKAVEHQLVTIPVLLLAEVTNQATLVQILRIVSSHMFMFHQVVRIGQNQS